MFSWLSGEVDIVELHIKALSEAGLEAKDIAVIAPYNLQASRKIRTRPVGPHLTAAKVKIPTQVSEIQALSCLHVGPSSASETFSETPSAGDKVGGWISGQRKRGCGVVSGPLQQKRYHATIIKMILHPRVHCFFSFLGEVGFLAEDRRINVAVTRARRHIAIVCDTHTVQNHAFLKSLIDHVTQHGEVRTAFEYIQDIVPQNYTHGQKERKTDASATRQKVRDQPPNKAKEGKKMAAATCGNVNAAMEKGQKSAKTTPAKEEESKSRYSEIKKQVELFLKDGDRPELQFPSFFNSHDRLLVHQVAEELGLTHESQGEGKDRQITVSRPVGPVLDEQPIPGEQKEKVHPNPSESTQEVLHQPPLDLKGLHLERMNREQQKREEKAQQRRQENSTPPASSSKKNKSAKGL